MTSEEAEKMITALTEHFGCPVMPIRRYCDGLRAWQEAIHDRAQRLKVEMYPGIDGPDGDPATRAAYERWSEECKKSSGPPFDDWARWCELQTLVRCQQESEAVDSVFLRISKSNLLARILYGGEPLRNVRCPEHKGRWSGVDWDGTACEYGCELTGWLPEKPQTVEVLGANGELLGKVST